MLEFRVTYKVKSNSSKIIAVDNIYYRYKNEILYLSKDTYIQKEF